MKFTCNGTITNVTVGGMMRSGKNQKMKLLLRIWKENATEPGIYHKSEGTIVLALNNMTLCNKQNKQYICQLMGRKQVSVEPGDILGIEVPPSDAADFGLHSVSVPGPMTNYIFKGTNLPSTVNLCKRINEIEVRPLIMFGINRTRVDSGIHDIINPQTITYCRMSYYITGNQMGQTTPSAHDQSISCSALTTSPPSVGLGGKLTH
jgi:hypothetical protein